MNYYVSYEIMPPGISLIIEKAISVDVDPNGDLWTQINRAVHSIDAEGKVVRYILDEEADLICIADYEGFC